MFLDGATYEVPMQSRGSDYIDVVDTTECQRTNVYATPPSASPHKTPRNPSGDVGAIDSQFAVFSTGTQAYSVPFEVPVGTDEATYAQPTPTRASTQDGRGGGGGGDHNVGNGGTAPPEYALFLRSGLCEPPPPLSERSTLRNGESQT